MTSKSLLSETSYEYMELSNKKVITEIEADLGQTFHTLKVERLLSNLGFNGIKLRKTNYVIAITNIRNLIRGRL